MKYLMAPELEKMGEKLVAKHHPALKILDIGYVFRDEAPNPTNGVLLFGQAISIDSRNWLFHRKDVMVMICQDLWMDMPPEFQELLLDHELCHIGLELEEDGTVRMDETTGRPKVRLRPHDIEEFHNVMKWYGPGGTFDRWREYAQKQADSRMSAIKKKTNKVLNDPDPAQV